MVASTNELFGLIDNIANKLRGPYRPPQYRRVMLPMTVLRRFDCLLMPTKAAVLEAWPGVQKRDDLTPDLIETQLKPVSQQHFANYSQYDFKSLLEDTDNLTSNLTNYIDGFTISAKRIFDRFGFAAEIERMEEANRLYDVVEAFGGIDLHPDRVNSLAMGHIFEQLIRKYNEMANEEAGDHFTPRDVIRLMSELIFTGDEDLTSPNIVRTIYDPACGTGGMLTEAHHYLTCHNDTAKPELFGQDYNEESWAMCASEMLIKGQNIEFIAFGDSLGNTRTFDAFQGHKFDYMMANPPFGVDWGGSENTVTTEYAKGFQGRFGAGLPRKSDGALLFLQHMISKMKPYEEGNINKPGSKIAVVFNGSPLFTGEPGPSESNIRRWVIENDWLDAIIALPDQMFFNTGINTYIWLLTNRKPEERRGKIKLVDASQHFTKLRKNIGNKRKTLQANDEDRTLIEEITRLYADGTDGERVDLTIDGEVKSKLVVREFDNAAFGFIKLTIERPYQLRFEMTAERLEALTCQKPFLKLPADGQWQIMTLLADEAPSFVNRDRFLDHLHEAADRKGFHLTAPAVKAIWQGIGVHDDDADICYDSMGRPEPNPDLRDYEIVPLPLDTPLPISDKVIGYGKGANPEALLDYHGLKAHLTDYFTAEVAPHWPHAWVEWSKTKLGYEIPFTRHFYEYEPPRPLDEIEADIKRLTDELVKSLGGG